MTPANRTRYLYLIRTGHVDRGKRGYKIGSSYDPYKRMAILQKDGSYWKAPVHKLDRESIYRSSSPSPGRPYRMICYGLTHLSMVHFVPFGKDIRCPEKTLHQILKDHKESVYELFWLSSAMAKKVSGAFQQSKNTDGIIQTLQKTLS